MWVRDHRPTSSHKWIQGMVLSKVGAVSYVVDLEGHQRKVHVDHLLQRSSPSLADQDMQVSTFKGNPASTTQSATTGGTGPEPAPPELERPAVPTSPGEVQQPQDEPLAPQLPQSGTQPVPANPQLPVPQAEPQPTQAESQVVKEAPLVQPATEPLTNNQRPTGNTPAGIRRSSRASKAPNRLIEQF